jgi:hypothetical protein
MNPRRLILLLTALALTIVLLPAAAAAKGGTTLYAPPGHAGASEYSEDLPTGGGSTTQPTNLSAPSPVQLNKLGQGKQGARRLQHKGSQGKAAANWARATAPSTLSGTTHAHAANLQSGSATSGILNVLGGADTGGLGAVLPLLLALVLAAAVGFALGRRGRLGRSV